MHGSLCTFEVLTQDFCLGMLRDSSTSFVDRVDARTMPAFVCKYFMSAEAEEFRRNKLERHFQFVRSEKMSASRSESREQYWVCIGFRRDL